jgi:hypothetical protein
MTTILNSLKSISDSQKNKFAIVFPTLDDRPSSPLKTMSFTAPARTQPNDSSQDLSVKPFTPSPIKRKVAEFETTQLKKKKSTGTTNQLSETSPSTRHDVEEDVARVEWKVQSEVFLIFGIETFGKLSRSKLAELFSKNTIMCKLQFNLGSAPSQLGKIEGKIKRCKEVMKAADNLDFKWIKAKFLTDKGFKETTTPETLMELKQICPQKWKDEFDDAMVDLDFFSGGESDTDPITPFK